MRGRVITHSLMLESFPPSAAVCAWTVSSHSETADRHRGYAGEWRPENCVFKFPFFFFF